MSEAFEQVDFPKPAIAHAMVGAASPLWGYFAGAAMGGVAFWWAAKLAQPATYQDLAARLAPAEPRSFEAAEEVVEAAVEAPFVAAAEVVSSAPSAVDEVVEETASPPANDANAA